MPDGGYNGWENWGTWAIALHLNNTLYREDGFGCSESGEFRDLIDAWLESSYGQTERWLYDEICAAHRECDYWQIAKEFGEL